MEDQSTDAGDLTETSDEARDDAVAQTPAPTSAPVGKRGRHRSFRPRAIAAPQSETAQSPAEAAAEASDDEPTDSSAESEAKPKRRKWFRGSPADAAADEDAEPVEYKPVRRRPVSKAMAVTVSVAAALFVAAGAFAGAMVQPYLSDRVLVDTKLDIARTASNAITTLFTYTPDDMGQLPARTSKYLGGELKDAYAKQVDALAATNKQNQIHRNAEVVGAAVESLSGNQASAIVYANVSYTSAVSKDIPKINLVTYRLSLERKGSHWLITKMLWVTSKDLTKIS